MVRGNGWLECSTSTLMMLKDKKEGLQHIGETPDQFLVGHEGSPTEWAGMDGLYSALLEGTY